MMSKPSLVVKTVYFVPEDRAKAQELGEVLYDHLTRPRSDALAFGPGIPVRIAADPEAVKKTEAALAMVVAVLGQRVAQDEGLCKTVAERLDFWKAAFGESGAVLAVTTAEAWTSVEAALHVPVVRAHLERDEKRGFEHTALELVSATCWLLRGASHQLQLYISHANSGADVTRRTAQTIRNFAERSIGADGFIATTMLEQREVLPEQPSDIARDGMFLAVHSDAYSSRPWCQRALLWAKRNGLSALSVEVLEGGEARSYPYAGNSPTIVWSEAVRDAQTNASRVILQSLVAWLRARHFEREAKRLAIEVPGSVRLSRPPELLDLAQGPLFDSLSSVVLHPDPELSHAEREVLRAARPRIKLVTPATLYRGIDNRPTKSSPLPFAPLRGHQIALSVSDVIDASLAPEGIQKEHLTDAVVHLTRVLIGAGATIAYGGNFRVDGYDQILSDLIATYNAAGVDRANYVYSYLPATVDPTEVRDGIGVNVRALSRSEELRKQAFLSVPEREITRARSRLYASEMYHVMMLNCLGCVMLGGQSLPKRNGETMGYGGPYPGVVEQAWHALKQGKPLYVIGGFGGAAALVAALAKSADTPRLLDSSAFARPEYSDFHDRARAFEADEERKNSGIPGSLPEVAKDIRELLGARLESDAAARSWNGLTVAENEELWESRDLVRIASLVTKGLFESVARGSSEKVTIELVRGDVVRAQRANVITMYMFDNSEANGVGAALDRALGGAVSLANRAGERLIEAKSPLVDAEWVWLAGLGKFPPDPQKLGDIIEEQAKQTVRIALRHNFERIALTTFAANSTHDVEMIAERMLAGFAELSGRATLQWFDANDDRFERLEKFLREHPLVALSVREPPDFPEPVIHRSDPVAFVRLADETLQSTLLLPSGAAVSHERASPLGKSALEELNRPGHTETPALAELEKAGAALASLLFGDDPKVFDGCENARLIVQHDVESAALPFEALHIGGAPLAVKRALVRRPSMATPAVRKRGPRAPRSGFLKLLLIVNPTLDLKEADREADAIRDALDHDDVTIDDHLRGANATQSAVLSALQDENYDVVHFSGHAFFDQLDANGSGLLCADQPLKFKDLLGKDMGPRVVFFNACQSAHVRGKSAHLARSLAEYVLQSGVEAYLGTYWPVKDKAAADFAARVYRELARGEQLDEAVRIARKFLYDTKRSDWANYALYGSGAFRLKAPSTTKAK